MQSYIEMHNDAFHHGGHPNNVWGCYASKLGKLKIIADGKLDLLALKLLQYFFTVVYVCCYRYAYGRI